MKAKIRFDGFVAKCVHYCIEDVAKVTSGGTPNRANIDYWNGNIPWVTTSQIDFQDITNADEYITELGLKSSSAKMFPKGTILMALYGQGITRGRVSILGIDATTNQACAAILVNKVLANNRYTFYSLQSKYEQIRALSNDGGQKNLSGGLVKKLSIYLPSLQEQQKIADFLIAVDSKISLLMEKHRLLNEYKKGAMQQLFSQQLRFKDKDGNAFPEWREEAVGKYLEPYKELVPANTNLPILTSSRTGLYLQERTVINEGQYGVVPLGYFTYRHMSDDLIFKFNVNRLYERGAVSKEYPVFKTVGMDTYFLELKLNEGNEFKRFAIEQKQGGTRTRLYFKNLKELKLTLPCLAEQQKITQFLQSIDKKITAVAEQIEQTKQFKKGLLQQMFV
ncbi:MAG: restriction endonuclease subunit S [Shewanella xiamenensis]